jgi:nonsense-mediated mRNA decay protein 3
MIVSSPTAMLSEENSTTILCPTCGIHFQPKLSNICEGCMIAKTDITIGITKEALINMCRFCKRYNRPPWTACERDSKEMLSILLKKVKGLNRARVVNAGFIWTEQHSRRLKVKITIEKEMGSNAKI